jgi:hypothetical protein
MRRLLLTLTILVALGCSEDTTGPSSGPGVVTITGTVTDANLENPVSIRLSVQFEKIEEFNSHRTVARMKTGPVTMTLTGGTRLLRDSAALLQSNKMNVSYRVSKEGIRSVAGQVIVTQDDTGASLNWSASYQGLATNQEDVTIEDVLAAAGRISIRYVDGEEQAEFLSNDVTVSVRGMKALVEASVQ